MDTAAGGGGGRSHSLNPLALLGRGRRTSIGSGGMARFETSISPPKGGPVAGFQGQFQFGFEDAFAESQGNEEDDISPDELAAQWEQTLVSHGKVKRVRARELAAVFVDEDLPPPASDCKSFMTHEFLETIGVTKAGERARIILALERMPPAPPPSLEDDLGLRLSNTFSGATSTTYSNLTTEVALYVRKKDDMSVKWFDLVGKDVSEREALFRTSQYGKHLARLQKLFDAEMFAFEMTLKEDFLPDMHPGFNTSQQQPMSGGGRNNRSRSPVLATDQAELLTELAHQMTFAPRESRPAATAANPLNAPKQPKFDPKICTESEDLWSIMAMELPLPHVVYDPDDHGRCAFVLRVCTNTVSVEDATFGDLTNRWVIFADENKGIVAVVHRVDSIALATLRDKDFATIGPNVTFKHVLVAIFQCFFMEFEMALDAGNDSLDAAESEMLDHTKHDKFLKVLWHLERKASVYDRVIDLNQTLVTELGHYFGMERDIAFLEQKWTRLREKTAALGSRSNALLGLLLELSGHRTNQLMAVLTRFSLVFTPLTFIAGIYGMNFDVMPELRFEYGYYVCLSVMFVIFVVGVHWSSRL